MNEREWRVEMLPAARQEFKILSDAIRERVVKRIRSLKNDPRPRGCRKLAGTEGAYRLKVGSYRIIYRVYDREAVLRWVALCTGEKPTAL
ncbi:MAG: type II toxin-antitoxin system RelE/ParE family toxin [Calditrichota bacterium]